MSSILHNLARNGDISWLSYYFAEFVAGQAQAGIDDLLSLSAALVSEANQRGNVCIELGRYNRRPLFDSSYPDGTEIPCGIDSDSWCTQLRASPCVGGAGESAPLTLDGDRLYLNRYWNYEEHVAGRIRAMLEINDNSDAERIAQQVEQIFPDSVSIDADQKHAVATAAQNHFCVVSGGPGSGKTSTVVRLLAVLMALDPGHAHRPDSTNRQGRSTNDGFDQPTYKPHRYRSGGARRFTHHGQHHSSPARLSTAWLSIS